MDKTSLEEKIRKANELNSRLEEEGHCKIEWGFEQYSVLEEITMLAEECANCPQEDCECSGRHYIPVLDLAISLGEKVLTGEITTKEWAAKTAIAMVEADEDCPSFYERWVKENREDIEEMIENGDFDDIPDDELFALLHGDYEDDY